MVVFLEKSNVGNENDFFCCKDCMKKRSLLILISFFFFYPDVLKVIQLKTECFIRMKL